MTERDRQVFVKCAGIDKGDWIKAASAKRMKLEDWINETLNEAARRADIPPPAWMTFSKRTTAALIGARIHKESELIARIEEDSLFNIEGIASDAVKEVEAWYRSQ